MLRVKILINLQVGSVRVKELRDTLCVIVARFTWKPSRGSIPFIQRAFAICEVLEGFVRPELTFSLVLTLRILTG